jgi:peptidoglycan LD-endopeptidase LytH
MSADTAYLRSRGLMVPVLGVYPDRVHDTFNDERGGGARVHRAIDIMAPRGTPVLSADDGRILRMETNRLGGISIFAVDPAARLVYYYAHLDRYEPLIHSGSYLTKGEVIGYVGSTGDASPDAPHLHFQVMRRPEDARRWWDGTPIDPWAFFSIAGLDR